jgi:carboxyl-terminal processing protease
MPPFKQTACAFLLGLALASAAGAQEHTIRLPRDEVRELVEVFDLIKNDYVGPVDDRKLMTEAIAGMVASLDAHSQFLGKEDLDDVDSSRTGNYVGIGVEVEVDSNAIRVISAIENSPAERAGIQAGDTIVGVDNVTINDARIGELSRRLMGEPGTPVTLAIARPGEKEVRKLTLKREALHGETVKARMVASGVAWIRITHFQETTPAELAARLSELGAQQPLKGVVLDLRNDPGGVVSAAVGVSAAFLPQDAVVFRTRGRAEGADAVVTAEPRYYRGSSDADPLAQLPAWTKTVPLAVLVNGASASASEIVAGALQDHKRGVIVGTQTFGKGSIQGVIRLSDTAGLKLTVARYYTPEGHSIQATGIRPDIVVPAAADGTSTPEFTLREADLPHHLPAEGDGTDNVADSGADNARKPAVPAAIEKTSLFGTAKDKALTVAVANLGRTASSDR